MQVKYVHLNLRLDSGIPSGAMGVVPELTGAAPMGFNTNNMLKNQQNSLKAFVGAQDRSRKRTKALLNLVQMQRASGLLTL